MTSCEYMYEVVISLNNAAVSLLVQHQRYRDAMETLTEALTTLKILFHRMELETQEQQQQLLLIGDGSSSLEQQHTVTKNDDIVNKYIAMTQLYLSNASKRLARPTKHNSKVKVVTYNNDNLIVSNVANIDDIANVVNSFSINSINGNDALEKYIFRIDCDRPYHDNEIWENIDTQFISTILLYNCGMACELGCTLMSNSCNSVKSSTHSDIIEKTKLRESSMRYYQLAFQTICRHLEQYSSTLCPQMNMNEVTDLTKIVWLSLQVSRCLHNACIDCGMQIEAQATYREHCHLYELFSTIRHEFEKIPVAKAIAASAA